MAVLCRHHCTTTPRLHPEVPACLRGTSTGTAGCAPGRGAYAEAAGFNGIRNVDPPVLRSLSALVLVIRTWRKLMAALPVKCFENQALFSSSAKTQRMERQKWKSIEGVQHADIYFCADRSPLSPLDLLLLSKDTVLLMLLSLRLPAGSWQSDSAGSSERWEQREAQPPESARGMLGSSVGTWPDLPLALPLAARVSQGLGESGMARGWRRGHQHTRLSAALPKMAVAICSLLQILMLTLISFCLVLVKQPRLG